jgi:outer membrane protein assembly factor BamB
LPADGLHPRWRTPIAAGYAGPAVSEGRVFVTDYRQGIERALALDEETGRVLWAHQWPADYRGMDYASGPRATPTVDGDRVYVLGATGMLWCLETRTGAVLWNKNFVTDYGAVVPGWGTSNAPIVAGNRLIAITGGRPDAKIVAFDKRTGRELWRSLNGAESEQGYSQPIISDGKLIVWDAGALRLLEPATGRVLWDHPFRIHMNTPIATPAVNGSLVLVSGFFNGARLLRMDGELVWRGTSDSEVRNDTLHALMAAPVIDGDYIYGVCSYGQLRCLRLDTGERVWETQDVTREKVRNASAHIVRNGDRYWIFNDRGELIVARFSPEGYREISRAKLIRPTSTPGARRELGAVVWSHPAFANRHIYARNDEEILSVSLKR